MSLKPETIARLQGILDGTIKVEKAPPADLSNLSAESRAKIKAQLSSIFEETKAQVAAATAAEPPVHLVGFEEEDDMEISQPSDEGLRNADEIIETLAKAGHGDYSAFRNQIALDIYENGHWNGNWDSYFNPDDYDAESKLPSLRVIQEDEYDQHMDEDEDEDKPDHDSMVASVPNGYLWIS